MGLHQEALSGMKWTSIASFCKTILQIAQLTVLGRLLSPDDFGVMAMIMVVIGFAQIYADAGVSNAIIYHQNTSSNQLSSLYWLNVTAGSVLFILIIVLTPYLVEFFHEPHLAAPLFGMSLVFLLTPFGQQFQILLEKELRFNTIAIIEILSVVLGVSVSIMAAFARWGVFSLVLGQLANAFIKTILLVRVGFRVWRPRLYFRRDDLKGYLGFGMYQIGEKSVNYLGWNLDKLLIGFFLGAQELGYYNVAYQLMTKPFQAFNPIITRVAFPIFARLQESNQRLRRGYLDVIRIIALVLFPVYMGMIVLAKPFIIFLLGNEWLPAVPIFQILAVLGFFYSLGNPIGSLLLAKGRADIGFYFNVLVMFLYGIVMSVTVRFGVKGVALGLVISTVVVLFPIGFWIRWMLVRMRPGEFIMAFVPTLIAALIMGGGVSFLDRVMGIGFSNVSRLMLLALWGGLIYIPIVFYWHRDNLVRLWKYRY